MRKYFHIFLSILVFISTIVIGVSVGSPIAVEYYQLSIPSEASQLFFLMPFVYFFASIPMCALVGYGFKRLAAGEKTRMAKFLYIAFSIVLVPIVFYGVAVPLYYG